MEEVVTLPNGINIYNKEAFKKLKEAGEILAEIRDKVLNNISEGISTLELDQLAENLILKNKCKPLFKGFEGFPYTTCMSNNHVPVHGYPNKEILKKGDVLSVDLGLRHNNGYCADSARTIIVGDEENKEKQELIEVSRELFLEGYEKAFPGNTTGDIGFYTQKKLIKYLKEPGNWRSGCKYKTFSKFSGHGIGLELHEKPNILPYGNRGKGYKLLEGMCICIEPVLLYSSSKICSYSNFDGFKVVCTNDGKNTSHYENQVYISSNGPVILT